MRLSAVKTAKGTRLYVIKSTYDPKTKKRSTKIVEKLGREDEIRAREGCEDARAWAKAYVGELNRKEKEEGEAVLIRYRPSRLLESGRQRRYSGGYVFLQRLYHELKLDSICDEMKERSGFEYDLDAILSRLIYGRVLSPSSKRATFEFSKPLLEPPVFEQHQVYRALEVLAAESDAIQAALYKNSLALAKRKDTILYYDCTNFFFEIEEEEGLRRYGHSKEHRPNPIVQMGLFMDAGGVPLAFRLTPGSANEQVTLRPLEKTILKDFELSRFIVCTDAGLSSKANREFNTQGGRSFVTAQSVKTLPEHLKKWALKDGGWRVLGLPGEFKLSEAGEERFYERVFYKQRQIKDEDGFEQRLIVTFSFKYRRYQSRIRENQVIRAERAVAKGPRAVAGRGQNDPRRLIETVAVTKDGEIAEKSVSALDLSRIAKEAETDGFYAVATNLEDSGDIAGILKVNAGRWQIEECFRILKSEFRARPVYLSRDERIKAHFLTCFIALLVYRLLEQRLGGRHTCDEIIDTLRSMDFLEAPGEGYIPLYTRTALTDDLHEAFGFRTDYEIVTNQRMRRILEKSKKRG